MSASSPTIDNMIELAIPNTPQISPDGRWIAYMVSKPDWKENLYLRQIWVVENTEGAVPRQLTFSASGSNSPRWSPDSQYLAFLSKRQGDEGAQVYRMALAGGEAERLTELKTGIEELAWSPDGKMIAFRAIPPETAQEKERKEKYGDFVQDNLDYRRSQLWTVSLSDKKVRQVTAGDQWHYMRFSWSPDSQWIAASAMPSPDMATLLDARIVLVDPLTLTVAPLTEPYSMNACWSPDGSAIVYMRGESDSLNGAFYKNDYLEIITLADRSVTRVPMSFDENVNPLFWTADGVYFWAIQRTEIHLFRVELASGTVEQVTPALDGFAAMEYSIDAAGRFCGIAAASADRFWEIMALDVEAHTHRILTEYDQATRAWDLPRNEVYRWQSTDGTEIEGVLTRPLNFDPAKQYPLLVVIHGGPTWTSLRTRLDTYAYRIYPLYQWIAQDAIILQPNYRGSAGYGEAFRSLNVRDLGTGDYADVISGVDALIAEGWIDAERVGAMGWSQGGYISAFITTYSDRFKAVSAGAGISNWMTYYVNTDIHPFTINYLHATPWDDPEIYARTSPMTYIKNARTPTLIQHGEQDKRVPLPNAYELHQGLLDQGVESRLVVYPGMPHGPTLPKQVRHIMNDNFGWFNRHIFGIESAENDPAPLYIVLPDGKTRVADVTALAGRDGATLRIWGSSGELTTVSEAMPVLTLENVAAIVAGLQEQIRTMSVKKIVLFTEKADSQPSVLIALGCLQIAAGSLGGITVEHRAGEV